MSFDDSDLGCFKLILVEDASLVKLGEFGDLLSQSRTGLGHLNCRRSLAQRSPEVTAR